MRIADSPSTHFDSSLLVLFPSESASAETLSLSQLNAVTLWMLETLWIADPPSHHLNSSLRVLFPPKSASAETLSLSQLNAVTLWVLKTSLKTQSSNSKVCETLRRAAEDNAILTGATQFQ